MSSSSSLSQKVAHHGGTISLMLLGIMGWDITQAIIIAIVVSTTDLDRSNMNIHLIEMCISVFLFMVIMATMAFIPILCPIPDTTENRDVELNSRVEH
jgi:hypothetical protein